MNTTKIFIATFCLIGCSTTSSEKSTTCNLSAQSGYRTLTHDDVTREYLISLPNDSNDEAAPLLINFHGNGGCANAFQEYEANLQNTADQNNFIVVYPQGLAREKGAAEWNPGDDGSQSIQSNDLFFTQMLIEDVLSNYNVDTSRIYASGYSNGGMMVYGLACKRPDLIAAGGIMSGIMLTDTCVENAYTSIVHFHGTADDALPYEGNQDFQSVAEVQTFWLEHNNIPASSLITTELNNGSVVRDEYSGGNDNTSFTLYTISGGGHIWFQDAIDGTAPNQILWDFLSQYTRAE